MRIVRIIGELVRPNPGLQDSMLLDYNQAREQGSPHEALSLPSWSRFFDTIFAKQTGLLAHTEAIWALVPRHND